MTYKNSRRVTRASSALILISFFLPWFLFSCESSTYSTNNILSEFETFDESLVEDSIAVPSIGLWFDRLSSIWRA